ncbi:TPA: hypothetical protein L4T04_005235 [Pseudomonas aeruginosa]|nr:hypothetical protein [Pseudomonas aeruginosa]
MQDPKDPGTLDLIEACKRPLTAAERQKRHREKLKRERQAGKRAVLDLGQPELALLTVALREFGERWSRVPSKTEGAAALLSRLPAVSIAEAFPGDSAWIPDALQQGDDRALWPACTSAQRDIGGFHGPYAYRQTPHGQPEVDELVKPGDQVWTSYDSGPYKVLEVKRYTVEGMRVYSLVMTALNQRKPSAWVNELVAVDGRLLKLFANNMDEVFVVGAGALASAEPLPEPVRQMEEERAEANAWYQTGRRLEGEVTHLREQREAWIAENEKLLEKIRGLQAEVKRLNDGALHAGQVAARLKGLQDENGRVIAERAGAFRAVEVLQARLKRHGIDADFRETEDDRRALLGST